MLRSSVLVEARMLQLQQGRLFQPLGKTRLGCRDRNLNSAGRHVAGRSRGMKEIRLCDIFSGICTETLIGRRICFSAPWNWVVITVLILYSTIYVYALACLEPKFATVSLLKFCPSKGSRHDVKGTRQNVSIHRTVFRALVPN